MHWRYPSSITSISSLDVGIVGIAALVAPLSTTCTKENIKHIKHQKVGISERVSGTSPTIRASTFKPDSGSSFSSFTAIPRSAWSTSSTSMKTQFLCQSLHSWEKCLPLEHTEKPDNWYRMSRKSCWIIKSHMRFSWSSNLEAASWVEVRREATNLSSSSTMTASVWNSRNCAWFTFSVTISRTSAMIFL